MKKSHIVLIAVAAAVFFCVIVTYILPITLFLGGTIFDATSGNKAEIEIDSYRLCQDKDGKDVIIIKYLLKNDGKEPTALIYEGDFSVYQEGISLIEYCEELPKNCDYNTEDQYREIKSGVEYFAEIAYLLEYPDKDIEVEVNDYGLFDDKKEKVFRIK